MTARGMRIACVNDPSSGLTDAEFRRASAALGVYLACCVAPAYGLPPPTVIITDPHGENADADALLKDVGEITNVPDAEGYHTREDNGAVDGYVSTHGIDRAEYVECKFHEGAEMWGNPGVDKTHRAPNGDEYPHELCDAVQGMRFPIDLGDGKPPVMAANFVLPAYWDPATPPGTPVDYMGLLPGPFTIGPQGYSEVLRDGQWVQIGMMPRRGHAMSRAARKRAKHAAKAVAC